MKKSINRFFISLIHKFKLFFRYLKLYKIYIIVFLNIQTIIALIIAKYNPILVENIYNKIIYKNINKILTTITGQIPISLTEISLIILTVYILFITILFLKNIFKKKSNKLIAIKKYSLSLFMLLSIILITFYWCWGFNYYRITIDKKIVLNNKYNESYACDEKRFLLKFKQIINKANRSYPGRINVYNSSYIYNIDQLNIYMENNISDIYSIFYERKYSSFTLMKKPFTKILSLFYVSGVISPFLLESHYNSNIFYFEIPFIWAHEKSHIQGHAYEADCNFLAYLYCINSDNKLFNYSGYLVILKYFFMEIKSNHNLVLYFYDMLRPEIQYEFQRMKDRHSKSSSTIRQINKKMYNAYLKAQNVNDGIKNYNKVVKYILGFNV